MAGPLSYEQAGSPPFVLTPGARGASNRTPSQPRRIIVGHRGQVVGNFASVMGDPNDYTRNENRWIFVTPPVWVTDLQFAYANWQISNGQQPAPNVLNSIDMGIEVGSVFERMFFNNLTSATSLATTSTVLSDPYPMAFAPNTLLPVRNEAVVASGGQVVAGTLFSMAGDNAVASSSGTSQIPGTGPIVVPSGGAQLTYGYSPLAMIGLPEYPTVAVGMITDSIGWGLNDNGTGGPFTNGGGDGNGNFGWIQRGLWNSWRSPYTGLLGTPGQYRGCRSGDLLSLNTQTNSWLKLSMLSFCTHAIEALGSNDAVAGTSLATMTAELLYIWGAMRAHGCKVYSALLSPRTSSVSGQWLSAADQAYAANFQPGGLRDQLNLFKRQAFQTGLIDGILDPNAVWEDPSAPGKWITNGAANYLTADGIHSTPIGYALAGSVVIAPWAARLSV